MLVIAREFAERTQAELAQFLGVSQGTVSKIEENLIVVTDEMLKKFSTFFNRPASFFASSPIIHCH